MTDNPNIGLEPCPFCGKSNIKTFGPYGWYSQFGISHSCASFYSGTSEMMQGFPNEAEAIAAWNRRAHPTDARTKALEGAYMEGHNDGLRGTTAGVSWMDSNARANFLKGNW